MRYIGNKVKLLTEIKNFIKDNNIEGKIFCDIFSGTGSVGAFLKHEYKIISNDILYSSFVLTYSKLLNINISFEKLGLDPFEYLNNNKTLKGFIYNNYAPTISGRMYFSDYNAGRIDYIRSTIEKWKKDRKINKNEFYYLLSCLLESVSKISNVAGVYGSYLKKWDPRALKDIKLMPLEVDTTNNFNNHEVHQIDSLQLINDIYGDILYIDPPYTKNQYAVQYHILETITKYDEPFISGKTGKRDTSKTLSSFSKPKICEQSFEHLISRANFRHIIVSYSSDGLMSKEQIENILKKYGDKKTFVLKNITYRKYKNSKTVNDNNHEEYLFYIKKNNIQSPLNYIGGKYDMVDFIKRNLPQNIDTFVDLFSGGFNVGVNVNANNIIFNDINYKVKELIEMFFHENEDDILSFIKENVKKYNLKKGDKNSYLKLRDKYNQLASNDRDPKILYLLILYGYQQQIRFNSKLDYNNPVGQSGFNEKIEEKIIKFSRKIKTQKISFISEDFYKFKVYANKNYFFYCDPPYLITLGSYNDGKRGFNGWTEKDEVKLLSFLEYLNKKGVKFMLSNVLSHNGKENSILIEWIKKNNFIIKYYNERSKTNSKRNEIIIINYNENNYK